MMDMMDYAAHKHHKLVAILLVNIDCVDIYVRTIIDQLDEDEVTKEHVVKSISSVVIDYFHNHLPDDVYSKLIVANMLETYRTWLELSKDQEAIINNCVGNIINAVRSKFEQLSIGCEYKMVTSIKECLSHNKVFMVTSLDLLTFKNIEFRFFGD